MIERFLSPESGRESRRSSNPMPPHCPCCRGARREVADAKSQGAEWFGEGGEAVEREARRRGAEVQWRCWRTGWRRSVVLETREGRGGAAECSGRSGAWQWRTAEVEVSSHSTPRHRDEQKIQKSRKGCRGRWRNKIGDGEGPRSPEIVGFSGGFGDWERLKKSGGGGEENFPL